MTFKQATKREYAQEVQLLDQVIARLARDEQEIPKGELDFDTTGSVIMQLESIKRGLSE